MAFIGTSLNVSMFYELTDAINDGFLTNQGAHVFYPLWWPIYVFNSVVNT